MSQPDRGIVLGATIWILLLPSLTHSGEDSPQSAEQEAQLSQKATAQSLPARTHYKGREIAVTMHYTGAPWLVRDSREREEECSTLIKALKLKPNQTVCDLGCGNGFYALPIAKRVPQGEVLGVDIQPEMLRMLRERARVAKLTNIRPILGTLTDPKLPTGKVDLVLCVDAYHEFSHPEEMLRYIRRSLSPNGRLALVEFREEDPLVPIKPLHKMSKRQILKELIPNGFKLVEQFDALPWQHVMFFSRDDNWQAPKKNSGYLGFTTARNKSCW